VTIPNSVTSIGAEAFAGNLSLISISISEGLSYLGEKVFDRNYSLNSIIYCGKITGFPIAPTCTADKATTDKRPAEMTSQKGLEQSEYETAKNVSEKLMARFSGLKIKFPKNSELIGMENKASKLTFFPGKVLALYLLDVEGINKWLDEKEKIWEKNQTSTITCVKGKLTKKVTAVNPKCPSGYKKK
jgi:hypothetical protein